MQMDAPTNDCAADFAPANATLSDLLSLGGGWIGGRGYGDACSPAHAYHGAMNRLQRAISSLDLSVDVPAHPELKFLGRSVDLSGRYALALPDVQTLLGVQLGFTVAALIGCIFATILYRTIHCKKQPSVGSKTFIGSTLVLASVFLPYAIIDLFEFDNLAVRFTVCCLFVLYLFRTLEAVFGFAPEGAASSWGTYLVYFSLPFEMMFDEKTHKPLRATWRDVVDSHIQVAKAVACTILLYSALSPYEYMPFGESNAGEFHEGLVLRDYLDARHLGNCFCIALLFQQGLALADAGVGNAVQWLGYKARRAMRNPMLEATSPSDFWGRRWNVLVHLVLKRSVYKPVRRYASAAVASLAVFVASGLFHEWLVHAVLIYGRPPESVSGVLLGSNTAFFVWNALVIASERMLAGSKGIRSFGRMIPSFLVPFFIIMTSLPMAHWFGGPYLNGDYFAHYEKCLVLIRKV